MKLKFTRVLRDAVEIYISATQASGNPKQQAVITLKEQRQELRMVAAAAKRLLEAKQPDQKKRWCNRLVTLIDGWQPKCISLNTRDLLHRRLRRFDGSLTKLVQHLHASHYDASTDSMLRVLAADKEQFAAMLKARYTGHPDPDALNIVTRNTAIRKSKFHDQFLAELIRTLAPVWQEATGRSPWPRSIDREGDKKVYDFWEWLCFLIKKAGGKPPCQGSVHAIVRHLKVSKINTRHN